MTALSLTVDYSLNTTNTPKSLGQSLASLFGKMQNIVCASDSSESRYVSLRLADPISVNIISYLSLNEALSLRSVCRDSNILATSQLLQKIDEYLLS